MKIRQMLVSSSKYKYKCPYFMNAEGIAVHNTANDASANNEVKYMISNNNEVSFHAAVDDIEVVQGLPFDRNAWHAGDGGNGKGNRKYIAIEICYSKSGGNRFIQAEKNAAKYIAQLLKERGWGIDRVKKHQDFSRKYCPHRTLDMGWERFLNMIRAELGVSSVNVSGGVKQPSTSNKTTTTGDIDYKVYDNIRKAYLPSVTNDKGFAGNVGNPIGGIKAKCKNGNLYVQCHVIGKPTNKWESVVILNASNYNSNASNAYSGIYGKNIDCVKVWSDYGHVDYRVSPVKGNYYDWVDSRNRNNGKSNSYAGVYGKPIDRLQMK